MNITGKIISTLMIGLIGAGELSDNFGAKDTVNPKNPFDVEVFKRGDTQRIDDVYFTGFGVDATVNISSRILQTSKSDIGRIILHVEVHSSENDSVLMSNSIFYDDNGNVANFYEAGDDGEANIHIPYIWDFPIYVVTWLSTH